MPSAWRSWPRIRDHASGSRGPPRARRRASASSRRRTPTGRSRAARCRGSSAPCRSGFGGRCRDGRPGRAGNPPASGSPSRRRARRCPPPRRGPAASSSIHAAPFVAIAERMSASVASGLLVDQVGPVAEERQVPAVRADEVAERLEDRAVRARRRRASCSGVSAAHVSISRSVAQTWWAKASSRRVTGRRRPCARRRPRSWRPRR